jgi:hypothetical protein
MKYLKYFEKIKSASNEEICKTLEDILLELEDIGYDTKVYNPYSPSNKFSDSREIRIVIKLQGEDVGFAKRVSYIHKDEELFDETILRIMDYMKSEGYILNYEDGRELPIQIFSSTLVVKELSFQKYKKKYANLFKN